MKANTVSPAFTTNKVQQTRDFYVKYFGANVTFDCGWYVNLEFGSKLLISRLFRRDFSDYFERAVIFSDYLVVGRSGRSAQV